MKKIVAYILIMVCLLNITAFASQKNLDAISAPTYMLADGNNNSYLLEENCTTNLGVNNFAKIMTAILAIEKFAPTDLLTFTEETHIFYNNGFGNIAMTKPGLRMNVSEHLHNMILLYSDASAIALAKAHSGSEEAFVKAMNNKANQLSMNGTVFTSSDGHDSTGTAKTTVHDLYKLMRHAMRLPLFREICKTVEFTLPVKSDGSQQNFTSRNHMLSKYTYNHCLYSRAVAGFISFTESGTSFIAVCESNSRNLYALVMNTPDNGTQVYKDAINLAEHGFNDYQSVILAKKGTYLHQVPLKSAMEADAVLVTDRDVSALLPIGYNPEDVTYNATAPDRLKAPLKAGEACGTVQYFYQERPLVTCALVAEKDIKAAPFGWILRLFSKFNTWLVLIIIIAIAIPLYFHCKRLKRREELRRRKRELMGRDK